jgi:hypothetical protein
MFQKGDWEGCMQIKLPDPSHPKSSDVEKGQPTVSSRNNRNLPDSQMPPIVSADDVTTNTRSVTPPNAFSGAELFRRLAATQPEVIHPNSSFESILSSLQTNNAMNRRVTYDPTPDDSTAFFEKQILRDCLIRNLELQSMNRSSSMPMLHRRASLNDMNMRVVGLMHLNGNICHPMHRRLSLGDTGGMSRAHIDAQRLQMHGDRIMFPSTSTPSDAEVHSATQNIVSAAIDALRPKRRRLTVDQLPPNSGSTAYLDVMTEIFLERSRKVLSSRPVSIIGSRIQPQVETMTINSDQYMP